MISKRFLIPRKHNGCRGTMSKVIPISMRQPAIYKAILISRRYNAGVIRDF